MRKQAYWIKLLGGEVANAGSKWIEGGPEAQRAAREKWEKEQEELERRGLPCVPKADPNSQEW